MATKHVKKEKITRLKMEIQIKNILIKELMLIITTNNFKVPKKLLETINTLYGGSNE